MNDRHIEIVSILLEAMKPPPCPGFFPSHIRSTLRAFNTDREVAGSYPFQIVPEEDGSFGWLEEAQTDHLINLARSISVDQYLVRKSEGLGRYSLFFGYALLPAISRLLPPGYCCVHVGEHSLVIDDVQLVGIRLFDQAEIVACRHQLQALLASAH